MIWIFLFFLSGVVIATMILAKRFEEKRRKSLFILHAIKSWDELAHGFYRHAIHYYSLVKEKAGFWVKKLWPLKIKSYWNKLQSWAKASADEYLGDIRNVKLLKRNKVGISEFFKTISEIEKGVGEINEVFEDLEALVVEEIKEVQVVVDKPKKRTYNRKKVKVK